MHNKQRRICHGDYEMYGIRIAGLNSIDWLRRGLMLVLLSWMLPAAAQQTPIIDQIDVDTSGEQTRIRINFNVPLQYTNHSPLNHGDKIVLQMRPVLTTQTQDIDFSRQQSLDWKASPNEQSQFVRYEGGTPLGVQIGIYFNTERDFEVQPSSDARSLSILLPKPEKMTPPAPEQPVQQPPSEIPTEIAPTPGAPEVTGRYVLNLESSTESLSLPNLSGLGLQGPLVLYATQSPIDGRLWNRIRLGFFPTKEAAINMQRRIQTQYTRAWVAVANDAERQEALQNGVVIGPEGAPPQTPSRPVLPRQPELIPSLPALPQERLNSLMEEARQAMAGGDYARAIQIYTKVLQHVDTGEHQDAQEFLGLARERNGQLAHAKLAYEQYLAQYPDGPGAERVRQRLAGITTARMAPKGKLRSAERGQEEPAWDVYGSFSQYYRRDSSHIVTEDTSTPITARDSETRVNLSSLSTDLDITGRRRGGPLEIQSRFTGGYEHDFLDEGEGSGDISRVSSLYVDLQDGTNGVGGRLGRQTLSTSGVLGRFDGALLSYQWLPKVKLNAVSGFPVDSSKDSPDTERLFYGLSADFGTFANAWDFNAFIIEQQIDSITDRRAIGGEARYFDPVKSLLTFVDYDISYSALNTFLMLGNWNLPYQVTMNATIDYRKSPILTTRNAIQGQGVETLEDLRKLFTDDEIRQLAEDRTADSYSYTLGLNRPLNDRFQISGDVTLSKFGDTPASGGVEALPSTDLEAFYNLQLIGNNLLKEGDIAIFSLRYADTTTAKITSVAVNERYPLTNAWRVNPRLRIDYRQNENTSTDQWTGAPSILMDYLWRKRYRFELETGGEWSTRELLAGNEDAKSYYVYVGYRADF